MKRTKYKLIVKLKPYTIYSHNNLEYFRFKNKYYPIEEIEDVINSYKKGGVLEDDEDKDVDILYPPSINIESTDPPIKVPIGLPGIDIKLKEEDNENVDILHSPNINIKSTNPPINVPIGLPGIEVKLKEFQNLVFKILGFSKKEIIYSSLIEFIIIFLSVILILLLDHLILI